MDGTLNLSRRLWMFYVLLWACEGFSRAQACPPLWSFYEGNCYRFFGQRKSWHDAEAHCNGFFTSKGQAHLASIRDSSTNDLLKEMWKTSLISIDGEGDRVWIGLFQDGDGVFTWISDGGRDVPPNVWIPGQPDNHGGVEDCVDFWNDQGSVLGWNDESCDIENPFICMMNVGCY